MRAAFFQKLESDTRVLVCEHSFENTEEMILVYRSDDDQVSCVCNREHEMSSMLEFRWMHAQHIEDIFPQTRFLFDIRPDHVAMYFPDYEKKWVVESLLK